jgi:Ca2+-binding RTX toxin-like protein
LTFDISASDAGDDNVSSAGGAQVFGDITLQNINAILAGLYLSLQTTITTQNANLTVYGTAQSDTIDIDATYGSVNVESGAGDDKVTIKAKSVKKVKYKGGGGNDTADIEVVQAPSLTVSATSAASRWTATMSSAAIPLETRCRG